MNKKKKLKKKKGQWCQTMKDITFFFNTQQITLCVSAVNLVLAAAFTVRLKVINLVLD